MLIEFKVTNYRSIRDTQGISMVAGSGKEHLTSHTIDSGIQNLGRLVRSAVIYGPNAAGKTNVLRALQFMQSMVVNPQTAPPVAQTPHDPFKLSSATRKAPSEFEVAFVHNGIRYEYGFSVDAERVHSEWLIEYPSRPGRKIFNRDYDNIRNHYSWKFSSFFKGNKQTWREATRQNALFLSTAVQLNSAHLTPVFEWFQKRLVVIVGITSLNVGLTLTLMDQAEGKLKLLPFLREADPGIADVEMQREILTISDTMPFGPNQPIIERRSPGSPPNLVKISFSHPALDANESVKLDFSDESNGTKALFMTAGAWLNVFNNGEVLLFDEIDTSLHPLLTRFLIEQFHSESTNPNGAQIIFSTHDTSLLKDVFRRDQIWFVEKGIDRATKVFPLIEFSPRGDEAIERWYLRGRYGALPILGDLPS